ncbi:hypothetical protein [Nonomuraea sp. NPDC050310]|uniref:hypothetical protein n=1 Tax=Nonomuraea sp. NPDC050310 TaxID=3154935 RepID=UPI0033DB3E6E
MDRPVRAGTPPPPSSSPTSWPPPRCGAALLLAYGTPPGAVGAHPVFGGRLPYELAVAHGHAEVAELLRAAGAQASS